MNKTIRSGALALVFALAVGGCADKASFTLTSSAQVLI